MNTILFTSLCALAKLQSLELSHGSLKASSLLMTENLVIKICDTSYLNTLPSFVLIMSKGYRPGTYLCPIHFKSVIDKNWNPVVNKYKSDVFVLGKYIKKFT